MSWIRKGVASGTIAVVALVAGCDEPSGVPGAVDDIAGAYVAVLEEMIPEDRAIRDDANDDDANDDDANDDDANDDDANDDANGDDDANDKGDQAAQILVVHVWLFGDQAMSLDEQVVVIDHFDGVVDVRFVDQLGAAVDPDETETSVRDEGLLIALGPLAIEPPHTVRAEAYESAESIRAAVFTLERRDDFWVVTGGQPVDPEVLGAVA